MILRLPCASNTLLSLSSPGSVWSSSEIVTDSSSRPLASRSDLTCSLTFSANSSRLVWISNRSICEAMARSAETSFSLTSASTVSAIDAVFAQTARGVQNMLRIRLYANIELRQDVGAQVVPRDQRVLAARIDAQFHRAQIDLQHPVQDRNHADAAVQHDLLPPCPVRTNAMSALVRR